MKIHLNQIPPEGLHVEGMEDRDILELEDENIRIVSPIHYALDVGLSGSGLFASGTVETLIEFECVRCLQRFRYPLRLDSFALQTEIPRSETVDLTPFVREDILLDLPPHPRCDWNGHDCCTGAVHETGRDEQQSEMLAPRMEAWEELDKLNLRTGK